MSFLSTNNLRIGNRYWYRKKDRNSFRVSPMFILIVIFATMGISFSSKESKEELFWKWFLMNQSLYYQDFEDYESAENVFVRLSVELKKIHEELSFEFSPIQDDGIKEMTISAGGDKELFPIVQKLIENAPHLENWRFIALIQRIPGDDFSIDFGEITLAYSDIFFRFKDGDYGKIGIELNIRGYIDESAFVGAVYTLLDGLIGEYDLTMGIDWIQWVRLDESIISELSPILDLRDLVDSKKNH